ncbi:MAG: hypothetical protein MIO92_16965, partial [Methanosarcinaceae archaeon]|nr:hypothetical protein [Methanosarcinaceae archaeon]
IFSIQDIPSGKLYHVLSGAVLLHLHLFDIKPFYEYERTFIYHFYHHIYDGAYIGADLSDEI